MVPGRDNETPPDPEHLTIHQQMDIILLQDLEKVGEKYDVVTVKDGYGRNFLIPQKMAVIANTANMAKLDAYKDKIAEERAAKLATYQEQANKAANVTLKIGAKAGTSGKIFGSITALQIASALEEQAGIQLDRRRISFPEEVKELGEYTATLNFHRKWPSI